MLAKEGKNKQKFQRYLALGGIKHTEQLFISMITTHLGQDILPRAANIQVASLNECDQPITEGIPSCSFPSQSFLDRSLLFRLLVITQLSHKLFEHGLALVHCQHVESGVVGHSVLNIKKKYFKDTKRWRERTF